MRIAITGATGFVSQTLIPLLRERGHEAIALVRSKPGREIPEGARAYDPLARESVAQALHGIEGVVNLAGENLLGRRWNDDVKADLRRSRIDTTRTLVEAMGALDAPPRVLVSASAIGIYGPREASEPCLESNPGVEDSFLGVLCRDWEAAAMPAEALGTRVVRLRIGMVLGKGGGGLEQMETPFRLGLGGRVGSGKQIVSWIHLHDLCRLIIFCLETDAVHGAVNATAPQPVSNAAFTKAFAAQLHRPAFLPVPAFAIKLLFGPAAVVVLTGQRVLPTAAQTAGFTFEHPTVESAFAEIYP
jgi:uncharacterized protein (TIGR01777 family)